MTFTTRRFSVRAVQYRIADWRSRGVVGDFLNANGGSLKVEMEKFVYAEGIGRGKAGRVLLKDGDYVTVFPDGTIHVLCQGNFDMLFTSGLF